MFLKIQDALTPQEVERIQQIAERLTFIDGRATNPHNTRKKNRQADPRDSSANQASQIIMGAFRRNEDFVNFTMAEKVASPLLTKYEPGMSYGEHIDAAELNIENQRLRTDLSCTVFLNDPESYEGGELDIRLQGHHLAIKGEPGEVVVYPSTTYHRVRDVTKGQRLVAITFIQSKVRDALKRELIYEIGELYAFEAENVAWENRIRMEFIQQNLKRMWTDD